VCVAGERQRAKARRRPREQGEAKERSSRLRARAATDAQDIIQPQGNVEVARRRATERGRQRDVLRYEGRSEAASA